MMSQREFLPGTASQPLGRPMIPYPAEPLRLWVLHERLAEIPIAGAPMATRPWRRRQVLGEVEVRCVEIHCTGVSRPGLQIAPTRAAAMAAGRGASKFMRWLVRVRRSKSCEPTKIRRSATRVLRTKDASLPELRLDDECPVFANQCPCRSVGTKPMCQVLISRSRQLPQSPCCRFTGLFIVSDVPSRVRFEQ